MTNLVKKVQNTIFQQELFKRGDKIILAVSGGPDSVCMLNVFSKLQKKYSLELIVAHVNYGLRGKDSQKDEDLVRELAGKYVLEISVAHYRGDKKKISENALRNFRYAFFEELRAEKKFNLLSVAHNADDQVETFLMRIMRGAGMQGMSAMRFKNNQIIRPLLAITREEILNYLKQNKLTYRIDKTNLENKFLRNKIRNRLIPYLGKNFNPRIKETIFDSTLSISEDIDFLDQETEKYCRKFSELDVKKLLQLPPALLRRVLRQKVEEEKGDLKDVSVSNIAEIIKIVKSTKNKDQIVTFRGLKVTRKGDKLEISCTSR